MSSHCWTGYVDNQPACCWGLIPPTLMSDQAYLWLIVKEELVKDNQFIFVRQSQRWIERMLEQYPLIVGHCQLKAAASIRWMKWLGAKFGEPIEGNRVPFTIRAK